MTEARLLEIDALFALDGEEGATVYADPRRNISKRVLTRDGQMVGVRLAGEVQAQGWIKEAIAEGAADASLARWAVAPVSAPPSALPPKSRVVCKCADVSEIQITNALAQGGAFAELQDTLKCGTYCGACVPELKRMVAKAA